MFLYPTEIPVFNKLENTLESKLSGYIDLSGIKYLICHFVFPIEVSGKNMVDKYLVAG